MRLGININDYNLDKLRKINDSNTSKDLKVVAPKPDIFVSVIPDRRDQILKKMKSEMDSKLIPKISPRNLKIDYPRTKHDIFIKYDA